MSIPAVVLRDACTLLHEGEEIIVDGRNGTVSRASSNDTAAVTSNGDDATAKIDPHDVRIDRALIPPPAGRKERRSAKLRNYFLLFWCVYLLPAFLLPENVLYQPSLRFLDLFLWPLVRVFGKPGAVALIAAALGAITMFGQKYLTDNARLLVAKKPRRRLQGCRTNCRASRSAAT